MDHILNLLKEQPMNQTTPPAVTERAQISMGMKYGNTLICRFNSARGGEKAYEKLHAAWGSFLKNPSPAKQLHVIKHDMFESVVDLSAIALINFVDFEKRAKFVPWA